MSLIPKQPKNISNFRNLLILSLSIILVFTTSIACKKSFSSKDTVDNKNNSTETDKKTGIRNLSYSVELQEFVEDKKQDPKILLPGKIVYKDKDQIRLRLKANSEGYIYLVHETSELLDKDQGLAKYIWLFPLEKKRNLLEVDQEIKLPEADLQGLQLAPKIGGKLWLVFAENKLMGLEMIKMSANDRKDPAVTDLETAQALKQMLEKYSVGKNEKTSLKIDENSRLSEISSSESIMTMAIDLESK